MMEELPEGWTWTTLGEIGSWTGGCTPFKGNSAFWSGGDVPWISPKDMKRSHIDDSEDHITSTAVESGEATLLDAGAVLVVVRSGILQRTLPIAITTVKATINQDIKALRPSSIVIAEFVANFLRARTQEILDTCCKSGTTVANIELPRFWEYPFPLPPLAEQRRIVAKIEELTARSRAARAALAEVPTLLEQFRQSVLASAFRGDLTADWRAKHPSTEPASELLARIRTERRKQWETKYPKKKYVEPDPVDDADLPELPDGWCWTRMEELSIDEPGAICAGPFGTLFKAKDFRSEGIPIIFLRHVSAGRYLTKKPGFMDRKKWESLFQSYSVSGGELLVTKLGDPPGVAAIYPENIGIAMVTPDVMKMSVNRNAASNRYLMHFLNSDVARRFSVDVSFGVTRLRMNLQIFRDLPVPLAPIDEQLALAMQMDRLFETIQKIAADITTSEQDLAELDQSILAKGFRGELVPQDPADEPASVLLERLRAEQADAPEIRTRRRKIRE